MRVPDKERMKRDDHDPPRPRGVFTETVKLIANHPPEDFAILFEIKKSRDVIDLGHSRICMEDCMLTGVGVTSATISPASAPTDFRAPCWAAGQFPELSSCRVEHRFLGPQRSLGRLIFWARHSRGLVVAQRSAQPLMSRRPFVTASAGLIDHRRRLGAVSFWLKSCGRLG